MIKILHIARPVGGVGIYTSLLTKYIDKNKFTNSIICNSEDRIIEPKDSSGKKIQQYHANLKREINLINDYKTFKEIIRIVKISKPDIIHCHSAKAGILGRLTGALLNIKTYYTPHAYSYLSAESRIKRNLLKVIERFFGLLSTNTLACSDSEYERAIKDLKINKNKVFVWKNSIESKIELCNSKILEDLPEDFICSIGRPSYQKNTELLIDTIKEIKKEINNIHLVILGAGLYSPLLNKIKEKIKKDKLEKNITLISWLKRSESMSVLSKCKLYVSTSKYEGLPYSILEAMCLSKPIVVTNVDGNKDLIKDNYNGFLVEENSIDIASKVIEILNDQQILEEMSIKAREEILLNYNIQKNIREIEKLYSL
jgi:glycosyltransferase involved in cell wall biosynthesis